MLVHQYFKIRNGNSETFPYGQLVLNYSNNSSYWSFINMAGSHNLKITADNLLVVVLRYIRRFTAEMGNIHGH